MLAVLGLLTQHAQLAEGHPQHGVHLQRSAVELCCPAWPPCEPVDAPQQVPAGSSVWHLHAAQAEARPRAMRGHQARLVCAGAVK